MNERWRDIVLAGHGARGVDGVTFARRHVDDDDPIVRGLALGALARLDELHDDDLVRAFRDPDARVRRRAAELAAGRASVDLLPLLHDVDPTVVEHAAWACGEHVDVTDTVLARVIELAVSADVALVRESAIAALGAIGDERGLPAILAGCQDVPAVRRRAVLALAPFDGPEVASAIATALSDRDWQVRQAAEDLTSAAE